MLENNKHVHLHFVVGTTQTSLIWLILLSVGVRAWSWACCPRSYTGAAAGATSAASRRTPSSISAGKTKLKASRADDGGPPKSAPGTKVTPASLARASSSDASTSSGRSSQRK